MFHNINETFAWIKQIFFDSENFLTHLLKFCDIETLDFPNIELNTAVTLSIKYHYQNGMLKQLICHLSIEEN